MDAVPLIARDGTGDTNVLDENSSYNREYEVSHTKVEVNFLVKPGCQWTYSDEECHRYLEMPVNSCNCGGVNRKQGGVANNDHNSWRIDPNHMW
ncbi:Pectin lyase fold/virulence factor [Apiospora kogelbergensis]|uniref:Pectin lyase fold/virulence factor n=1 Tax=Apiospora kogelbergensis TaxID=1337665 RepID=A0AAW0R5B7_9PEZI